MIRRDTGTVEQTELPGKRRRERPQRCVDVVKEDVEMDVKTDRVRWRQMTCCGND